MSVICDTSHALIGPCGPPKHSPFRESLMHWSTNRLRRCRESGENTAAWGGDTIRNDNIMTITYIIVVIIRYNGATQGQNLSFMLGLFACVPLMQEFDGMPIRRIKIWTQR